MERKWAFHLSDWATPVERGKKWKEREKIEKREEEKRRDKLPILSSFPGDSTVDVRRSKRQSSSLKRELRVETGIGEFRQTSRGRRFFLLGFYSYLKSHLMAWFWVPQGL